MSASQQVLQLRTEQFPSEGHLQLCSWVLIEVLSMTEERNMTLKPEITHPILVDAREML